jgi:hypothetical protein
MLRQTVFGFEAYQTAQGFDRGAIRQGGQLFHAVLAFRAILVSIAAQNSLDLRRVRVTRPIHSHAQHQVTRSHGDFDVVVILGVVQGVERRQTKSFQFRLCPLARRVLGRAKVVDQLGNPLIELGGVDLRLIVGSLIRRRAMIADQTRKWQAEKKATNGRPDNHPLNAYAIHTDTSCEKRNRADASPSIALRLNRFGCGAARRVSASALQSLIRIHEDAKAKQ